MAMRTLILIPFLWFLTACPHPLPAGGPNKDALPPRLMEALVLPPSKQTGPALAALASAAKAGSCPAAWARTRYLLDLYDAVRLQPQMAKPDQDSYAAAHLQLWSGLGIPGGAGRGELATRQVHAALKALLTALPAGCPGANQARHAQELLEADLLQRSTVPQALAAAVSYKRLSRSSSEMAPNAALRLAHWCLSAILLAAGGEPALQHVRLNQCLFPLFNADPSPYFEADPAKRPPDPPWTLLGKQLKAQIKAMAGSRLTSLAATLARAADTTLASASPSLPIALDLGRIRLPASDDGAPWDRTPLVLFTGKGYLVGGQAIFQDDEELDTLKAAIAKRLRGDRRGRVTLLADASSPARVSLTVGRAARLAGARTLELGVTRQVAANTTPGDVQREVFGDKPVLRLHGVPLSLIPLAAKRVPSVSRDRPHGLDYDPRGAPNQLLLRVNRGRATLSSKDGVLPPFKLEEIRATLEGARQAYPDDQGLLLLPGPGITLAELLFAASAASRTAGDRPLFTGLALAPAGLPPGSGADLAPVLRALVPARVTATPATDRAVSRALLRCYHQALRAAVAQPDTPLPTGELRFKRGKGKVRPSGGDLKDPDLRICAAAALASEPAPVAGPWTLNFLRRSGR